MKTYVRSVLLILITVWLGIIALRPFIKPELAEAQSSFGNVQFTRSEGGLWFFDTRTGDIWIYDESRRLPLWHLRLSELGAPLAKVALKEAPKQGKPKSRRR